MRAREVYKILQKDGWIYKRQKGSHITLFKKGFGNYIFSFNMNEDIKSKMISKIEKKTGTKIGN